MVARRKQAESALNGPTVRAPRPVHYPESDGKPMGETETHIREIMRLIRTLDLRFADRDDVYVGGDLLVYYEEGNPRAVVVPDVFVAVGAPKRPERRIWKLWEERIPPTLVIEVTSPSTRRDDLGRKRTLYARLGVSEYVLYDPLGEYLRPALQGFRLTRAAFEPMAVEQESLICEALAMRLALIDGRLQLIDHESGSRLVTPEEQLQRRVEQLTEEVAAQRELVGQQAQAIDRLAGELEARRALEAEVAELREMVRRLRPPEEA
jgi:Uma2 family endonuclease